MKKYIENVNIISNDQANMTKPVDFCIFLTFIDDSKVEINIKCKIDELKKYIDIEEEKFVTKNRVKKLERILK